MYKQQSLQKLSSSASNNRLKTCLQFLIIRANEKSSTNSKQNTTTSSINGTSTTATSCSIRASSPKSIDAKEANQMTMTSTTTDPTITSLNHINNSNNKKQRLHNQQHKQRQQQKQKHNQLASPPQDQVSSTQDQVGPNQLDDHDCQTSPMMLITTYNDVISSDDLINNEQIQDSPAPTITPPPTTTTTTTSTTTDLKHDDQYDNSIAQKTQSSPSLNYASTTTPIIKSSPSQTSEISDGSALMTTSPTTTVSKNTKTKNLNINSQQQQQQNIRNTTSSSAKRRKIHNSSDHDTSSTASWSSSYASPPSPISTSSMTSRCSRSSSSSSCSSSSLSPSPSPSPISSPDIINELRGPRLKLSEEKIRKIKKRPILFDDNYYTLEHSFASTPTTSSGCSPGQHSNTTQNSDQSRSGLLLSTNSNMVMHMFQAPPKFVNNLKPCNLPTKPKEPTSSNTPPVPTKEMLNCAICGIKDRPPNITKIHGQNSCLLCTRFFATFLKRPQQLYCAQDGDCLMTFDSRCQACWIKICLQKFDIDDEHRKTGQKYSPKLLSSPNVSLITIDTSLNR